LHEIRSRTSHRRFPRQREECRGVDEGGAVAGIAQQERFALVQLQTHPHVARILMYVWEQHIMNIASQRGSGRAVVNESAPAPIGTSRNTLGAVVKILTILLLVAILACVLLVCVVVASVASMPGQLVGGVGTRAGAVARQAANYAGGVRQAVQNATDPDHPPTGLTYDTEFSSFEIWHVGEHLPEAGRQVVVIQSIQRRQNAQSANTALYAVVHVELRQPDELRVLGQLVRSNSDAHDYALYKGETFRIAGAFYRVNWISQQSNAVAAGTYRNPDDVSVSLKFESD
jgi:hypothetical protein